MNLIGTDSYNAFAPTTQAAAVAACVEHRISGIKLDALGFGEIDMDLRKEMVDLPDAQYGSLIRVASFQDVTTISGSYLYRDTSERANRFRRASILNDALNPIRDRLIGSPSADDDILATRVCAYCVQAARALAIGNSGGVDLVDIHAGIMLRYIM